MASRAISSIYNQIRSKILISGPIPVAEYMKLALTQQATPVASTVTLSHGKSSGYYMNKDVFGQQGDFITSPEISQLFGEMVGVWGIDTWRRIGGPKKFSIVELGPGRGTLAKDVLRVFGQLKRLTGHDSEISLHLVEISPFLARLQAQTLCGSNSLGDSKNEIHETNLSVKETTGESFYHQEVTPDTKTPVYWYRDVTSLPKGFHFYIAHEFFDALPVHKLQKVDNNWREVLVDVEPNNLKPRKIISQSPNQNRAEETADPELEKFRFVISRNETPVISLLRNFHPKILADSRNHLEVSLAALQIYTELTNRLESDGGMSLIIDYGHEGTKEDTFRGFYRHALHDPLLNPGMADLTADVDFSIIRKVCQEKALLTGPITQKELLSRVGIDIRLKKLLAQCETEDTRAQLLSGYKMLMEDMGERFKCMAMFPKLLEDYRPALKISAFDDVSEN